MKWFVYGLVIVIGAIVAQMIKDTFWLYLWGFTIGCIATNVLRSR